MNDVENLIAQRDELLKEMCDVPLWVSGSVVETTRKVRGKVMPFYYLSHSIKGKNKITYISAADLKQFKVAAIEGDKIKRLQNDLSAVNMKLIKAGSCND